mgnify:CR=1 FL=1
MNYISPNSSHTPADNRNQKTSVVSSIVPDRKSAGPKQLAKSADTVALSSQAIDMSALETNIKQLPEVDTARVVELHNRIIAGDYEIDAASVAEKLLNLESTLDW